MTESEALLLATRLYVRMRAGGGRVIDAVWMTQNVDYAREVLRIAHTHADGEVQRLAARFEEVVFGTGARAPAWPAAPRRRRTNTSACCADAPAARRPRRRTGRAQDEQLTAIARASGGGSAA
ncbi:MAG: hypothetical protein QM661_11565 [Solimonas sp.]